MKKQFRLEDFEIGGIYKICMKYDDWGVGVIVVEETVVITSVDKDNQKNYDEFRIWIMELAGSTAGTDDATGYYYLSDLNRYLTCLERLA